MDYPCCCTREPLLSRSGSDVRRLSNKCARLFFRSRPVQQRGTIEMQSEISPPGPMNWYYADGYDRKGPFDEAAFAELLSSGQITPDTLVWRPGMPEWKPHRELTPA